MTQIIIRTAVLDDLEQVAEIENICFPKEQAASRKSLEQRLKMFGPSFMVAQKEDDGQIVGFINGTVSNAAQISDDMYDHISYDERADYQMIFGLDVLPEYRHEGIAGKLMEAMIQLAWNEGRRGLVLTCREHLLEFYERFGYVNEGISKSVHGNVVWYDMRLVF